MTLLTILLVGCVDIKDEALKYRQVNLSLLKNDPNSRNSKTNNDLTLGIQRELIKVVQESETFSTDPSKLTKIFDSNLTNLSTNKVSLSVPLGIPIKLFAYRYQEDLEVIQNEITNNNPVSFGKSNTFIVKEDTKNLTITLVISPNGIPGLIVEKNDNKTSDRGDTSLFIISLKTYPMADVEIPIETDFDGIMLSQKNLIFTPSNWSIPQTITLTGIDKNSIEIPQMYNVNFGKIISDDSDYSKIDINNLKFEHKILKKPIISEITPIGPLINFNSPNYTFSSTKRGKISLGGSCFSDNKTASVNNNTITFLSLKDGIYSNCKISVTDLAGNSSDNLSISSFTIDTTKPLLREIESVATITNDNTPTYTFSSSELGTIQYGGRCSSDNASAQADNNTVTLNLLPDGNYSNCMISVTDLAGNSSDNLSISSFTIDTLAPKLVSFTLDNSTAISSDNLSILADGFKATFNEAMKVSTMQVNDGSTGEIKINCNSANTLRLGADNITTPGKSQCREMAQMSSSDNLTWTSLIRTFSNSNCPVTDNLTGSPSGTCAATLYPGTNYQLILTSGMTDLAGNNLAIDNYTLFRTREAPSIIATFPDNGSEKISISVEPRFQFDSSMKPDSFKDNVSVMVDCIPNPPSGSNCDFSTNYDSNSDNLTINPKGSWPDNTSISITIKGRNGSFPYSGVYESEDGIFMASDYLLEFNTSYSSNDNYSWSDDFTKNKPPSTAQVTKYNNFWDNISINDGWNKISIGNPGNLVSCDNASEIVSLFKKNGSSKSNIQCNGNYWYVGKCGNGAGISVTPTTSTSCSCKASNVWSVRTNIGNNNWGGVGKECSAPSQTLKIILEK